MWNNRKWSLALAVIVASALAVTLLSHAVGWLLDRKTQAWRKATA